MREQITAVQFRDVLTKELVEVTYDYRKAQNEGENTDYVISEGYHRLMQRLGE